MPAVSQTLIYLQAVSCRHGCVAAALYRAEFQQAIIGNRRPAIGEWPSPAELPAPIAGLFLDADCGSLYFLGCFNHAFEEFTMRSLIMVLLLAMSSPTIAIAGFQFPANMVDVEATEESAYAGLAWSLGSGASRTPEVSIGFQSIDIDTSEDIKGGFDVNFRFALDGANLPNSYDLRVSHLFGEADMIGNAGIGYDSATRSLFATLATQTDHLRLGADFDGSSIAPSAEILSLHGPDAPQPKVACDNIELYLPQDSFVDESTVIRYYAPEGVCLAEFLAQPR
jgi:hypothetical protein